MENSNDPIEVLLQEHEEGLAHLERLKNATEFIRTKGFSFEAFMQVGKALRFIGIEIQQHNEKEEKYLFPLLDRHVRDPQTMLRKDHRELWRAYRRLLESVEDVEEGRIHATTVRELIDASRALIELLTSHFGKENEVLFPMTRSVLTPAEYEQLRKNVIEASVAIHSRT